jgi:hypothetical protein
MALMLVTLVVVVVVPVDVVGEEGLRVAMLLAPAWLEVVVAVVQPRQCQEVAASVFGRFPPQQQYLLQQ